MITIQSDQLKVNILEKGAEVCSIKNAAGVEFLWQADKGIWPRHAPVLFPIVGRLKNDRYYLNGFEYQMGQHGFARDSLFKLNAHGENYCMFEFSSDANSLKQYPFDFIFQIRYELDGNKLTTTYEVTNPSPATVLFSVGAHPGFNCRLSKDESLSDFEIVFDEKRLEQTLLENGLRSDKKKTIDLSNSTLALSSQIFDHDALVFENSQISSLTLRSKKSGHSVTMHCENWPYFGIWSKKGCSDFVCLEPWYGVADSVNAGGDLSKKDGMLRLEPGSAFICSFSVIIS